MAQNSNCFWNNSKKSPKFPQMEKSPSVQYRLQAAREKPISEQALRKIQRLNLMNLINVQDDETELNILNQEQQIMLENTELVKPEIVDINQNNLSAATESDVCEREEVDKHLFTRMDLKMPRPLHKSLKTVNEEKSLVAQFSKNESLNETKSLADEFTMLNEFIKAIDNFSLTSEPEESDSTCICYRKVKRSVCKLCDTVLDGRVFKVCDFHGEPLDEAYTFCPTCLADISDLIEYLEED